MVSEPRFLVCAFLEDVPNEITTLAGPEGAQGVPKSLQSLPGQVRNHFQMALDSRIHFWGSQVPLQADLGGPRHSAGLPPPGAGFQATFASKVQKNNEFLDFLANVNFGTPYYFLFLCFLYLCYGR